MPSAALRRGPPLLALALAGVVAVPALGVPAEPRAPGDGEWLETRRPEFSWTRGSARGADRYEVWVVGVGRVAEAPSTARGATAAVDLPDDRRLRWFVRIVHAGPIAIGPATEDTREADRRDVRIATPPPPPALAPGPALTASATPSFAWTGTRVSSTWTLTDAAGRALQTASLATPGGSATMAALADGAYVFRVVQRNLRGSTSPQAQQAFTVDTRPPAALAIEAVQAATLPSPTRTFRWSPVEAGGAATWRVLGAGGETVQGPVRTLEGAATVGPLPAGLYVFEVRGEDAAGNAGPWQPEPFAVAPPPAAAPVAAVPPTSRERLPTRNPARLRPRAGARVATARPLLRWTGAPAAARLFNVQVFRASSGGLRLRKVHTAFPATARYRLPRRARLTPGACYVWRVWPFVHGGFTQAPLGVSHFCVKRRFR
jgi:hypothetical protein